MAKKDKAKTTVQKKMVCCECGYHFLTKEQKESGNTRTGYFVKGICCICGDDTFVCDIIHYNNLKSI